MTLTRYGRVVWGPATIVVLLLGGLAVFAWATWGGWGWWMALVPLALAWIAVASFFRDPLRRVPEDLEAGVYLSPADGTVSAVTQVDHHESTGGPAAVVRIFLSVLNVHVNRSPCRGEVVSVAHRPGKYYDARTDESARLNESTLLTLRIEGGETIGVRQVTGKVARRIVCPVTVGDRLERGQKFGMIRFGSTAELILPRPDEVDVRVAVGDKVVGGITVLAVLGAVSRQPTAVSSGQLTADS